VGPGHVLRQRQHGQDGRGRVVAVLQEQDRNGVDLTDLIPFVIYIQGKLTDKYNPAKLSCVGLKIQALSREKLSGSTVTGLGEFSSIGRLFTSGSFFKITEVEYIHIWTIFSIISVKYLFWQKNGLGYILGNIFTNASGYPLWELHVDGIHLGPML
jgi:hypothetical protein